MPPTLPNSPRPPHEPRACAGAAQWRSLPKEQHLRSVDFKDTFLDESHVKEAFPGYNVSAGCHTCRVYVAPLREGVSHLWAECHTCAGWALRALGSSQHLHS